MYLDRLMTLFEKHRVELTNLHHLVKNFDGQLAI
jgi:hypothetical protein